MCFLQIYDFFSDVHIYLSAFLSRLLYFHYPNGGIHGLKVF